jgi:hypothetical protein
VFFFGIPEPDAPTTMSVAATGQCLWVAYKVYLASSSISYGRIGIFELGFILPGPWHWTGFAGTSPDEG